MEKQTEFKREPHRVPNLFLAQQRRKQGMDRTPKTSPVFVVIGIAAIVTAGLFWFRDRPSTHPAVAEPIAVSEPIDATLAASSESSIPASAVSALPTAASSVSATVETSRTPETVKGNMQLVAHWYGSFSQIKQLREMIIRDRHMWQQLWVEMGQPERTPNINFDRFIVFGVFAGDQLEGSTITLDRLMEKSNEVQIAYRVVPPAAKVPGAAQPYHLWVISRTDKPLRFIAESR